MHLTMHRWKKKRNLLVCKNCGTYKKVDQGILCNCKSGTRKKAKK